MSGSEGQSPQQEAWQRVIAEINQIAAAIPVLWSDRAATLSILERALHGTTERPYALRLLGYLDTDYTIALVDSLVAISISHSDALAVRRLLGRLAYEEATRTVPAAVWKQLDETPDDDAYRRLAELLRHLGLAAALRELCERALGSDDPEVREVGEDFGSWTQS
jgi:hypothetical protein